MENLANDIEALKATIREVLEKIKRLEAENVELRHRLGMDSTNSHKSLSSDSYQRPHGSMIIMDHARFHHSARTRKFIQQANCQFLFLPLYSPDLNPTKNGGRSSKLELNLFFNPLVILIELLSGFF